MTINKYEFNPVVLSTSRRQFYILLITLIYIFYVILFNFIYNLFTLVRPHVSPPCLFSLVDVIHVAVVYVALHRDVTSSHPIFLFFYYPENMERKPVFELT